MRVSTKMIIGYILLVMLPFLLFALFVYYQLYDKLITQYQLATQQNMEQWAGNLDASLGKIESLQSIYQNNAALIDYLRGDYVEDRDLIYSYLREIFPAISFAALAEPSVQDLNIFPKTQKRLLTVPGIKEYSLIYELLTEDELKALRPVKGLWKQSLGPDGIMLSYYHKIYNDSYTSDLGILEIDVKPALLGQFFHDLHQVHPDNTILLLDGQGQLYHAPFSPAVSESQIASVEKAIQTGAKNSFLLDRNQLLVHVVPIPKLGLTVVEISKSNLLFKFLRAKQLWVLGALLLLALLSILYYLIVSSFTKRIVKLSRHMRRTGLDSLGYPIAGKTGTDEIGFLIMSYNAMIARIHELVHRVQKVELLKKEADFKMLQAQIQPHFLYNTLETMRMLARANNDDKVAEMAFSLGNLLRYSLSKNNDTTLKEELEHVQAYIGIHQIRMEKLQFELEVEESLLALRCPRFILQPLVENSMLHGLSKKRGSKWIAIRMKHVPGGAILEVADNGAGITPDKLAELRLVLQGESAVIVNEGDMQGTGIGLSNVAERVKAYFGPDSEMLIDSIAGGETSCSLKLVLEGKADAETDDRGR